MNSRPTRYICLRAQVIIERETSGMMHWSALKIDPTTKWYNSSGAAVFVVFFLQRDILYSRAEIMDEYGGIEWSVCKLVETSWVKISPSNRVNMATSPY